MGEIATVCSKNLQYFENICQPICPSLSIIPSITENIGENELHNTKTTKNMQDQFSENFLIIEEDTSNEKGSPTEEDNISIEDSIPIEEDIPLKENNELEANNSLKNSKDANNSHPKSNGLNKNNKVEIIDVKVISQPEAEPSSKRPRYEIDDVPSIDLTKRKSPKEKSKSLAGETIVIRRESSEEFNIVNVEDIENSNDEPQVVEIDLSSGEEVNIEIDEKGTVREIRETVEAKEINGKTLEKSNDKCTKNDDVMDLEENDINDMLESFQNDIRNQ